MSNEFERDFDEEAYDEENYEQCFEGEELVDEEEVFDEEEEDAELDESYKRGVELSFACEDCDYRWDDVIAKDNWGIEDEDFDVVCPLCGSTNITQI